MFLSRVEYDLLLSVDQKLLVSLFDNVSHSWHINGVTFRNVPSEMVESVQSILYARPAK